MKKSGKVYLVGAGPGDPGLLTVRGKELLQRADVLVYDYLANPRLVDLVPPRCEKLFVGKKGGSKDNISQENINALIVDRAKKGKAVVRLKGGDSFVFGRGGEEAEELVAAGISFEVVPGITSGIAAPAYAGIPVTHREHCSQVTLLTGHDAEGRAITQVEWDELAKGTGTLVIYMGVRGLADNTKALIDGGRPKDTPAALIEWGTHPRQRTLVSTLEKIAADAEREGIGAPSIFIVGTVVELRKKLNWFENRPLFGKKILVTRAREQASELLQKLSELGAEPVPFPTIEIKDPPSWKKIDAALSRLFQYDWIVWTSVNGVERFFERLQKKKKDIRDLGKAKIAAIGPATGEALQARGLRVEVIPREF
ncbi:MAG: uroporphyrinogen-III C-methyltransferase, partial [Bdellovibrionota bacterium]